MSKLHEAAKEVLTGAASENEGNDNLDEAQGKVKVDYPDKLVKEMKGYMNRIMDDVEKELEGIQKVLMKSETTKGLSTARKAGERLLNDLKNQGVGKEVTSIVNEALQDMMQQWTDNAPGDE